MAYIRIEDYYRFKDYIHPHINDCIDQYRNKDIIHLPAYHGCDKVSLYNYRLKKSVPREEVLKSFYNRHLWLHGR